MEGEKQRAGREESTAGGDAGGCSAGASSQQTALPDSAGHHKEGRVWSDAEVRKLGGFCLFFPPQCAFSARFCMKLLFFLHTGLRRKQRPKKRSSRRGNVRKCCATLRPSGSRWMSARSLPKLRIERGSGRLTNCWRKPSSDRCAWMR